MLRTLTPPGQQRSSHIASSAPSQLFAQSAPTHIALNCPNQCRASIPSSTSSNSCLYPPTRSQDDAQFPHHHPILLEERKGTRLKRSSTVACGANDCNTLCAGKGMVMRRIPRSLRVIL